MGLFKYILGFFLLCNLILVFEMEIGNIVCVLNILMLYDNIIVMKND